MDDEPSKFDGLHFLIQYRRKDNGVRWHNMAAFDGTLAAERYFTSQSCDEAWPWEYQMIDIESGHVTRQLPQERAEGNHE
jgi:hypothetical protein